METVYREALDDVVTWEGRGVLLLWNPTHVTLLSPLAAFVNLIQLEISILFYKYEASPFYSEIGGV